MAHCLIALGSNLGDRAAQLRHATAALASLPGTRLVARSRWHETAPIGGPAGQGPFLNAAGLLSTTLGPMPLLAELRRIEAHLGRARKERWAARSLDVDLLLYDDVQVQTADLQIPHPRMAFRRFVLEPAAEIAGWMVHPDAQWTVGGLLQHLNQGAELVAVAAEKAEVAEQFVSQLAARLTLPAVGGAPMSGGRPGVTRWISTVEGYDAKRPKLLLAVDDLAGSAGTDARQSRRILHLPATGPVAWMAPDAIDEAVAAVQSVWPALAN